MGQIPVSMAGAQLAVDPSHRSQLCPGSAMAERIFLMKNNILGIVVQGWVLLVHCLHEVPAYCPKEKTTWTFKYREEPLVILFNFCMFSRA